MSFKKILISLFGLTISVLPINQVIACSLISKSIDLSTIDFSSYDNLELRKINNVKMLKINFIEKLHWDAKYYDLKEVEFYKPDQNNNFILINNQDIKPYAVIYFRLFAINSKNFVGISNIYKLLLTNKIDFSSTIKSNESHFPPLISDVYSFNNVDNLKTGLLQNFKTLIPEFSTMPDQSFSCSINLNIDLKPEIIPNKISDFDGFDKFAFEFYPSDYGYKYYFINNNDDNATEIFNIKNPKI